MPKSIRLVASSIPDLLPMLDRSEGAHVSAIINSLCLRLGHYSDDSSPVNMTRLQLGSTFEHSLANRYFLHYPRRYHQIGEIERDGIYGHPDLLDIILDCVEEVKLTWMSSKHDISSPKFLKFLWQLMAYCYMMGWTRGKLHVCYINGDYKGSGPIYRVWELEFSQAELAANWTMLLRHLEVMQKVEL